MVTWSFIQTLSIILKLGKKDLKWIVNASCLFRNILAGLGGPYTFKIGGNISVWNSILEFI